MAFGSCIFLAVAMEKWFLFWDWARPGEREGGFAMY